MGCWRWAALIASALACGIGLVCCPPFAGLFLLTLYAIPSNSLLPIPHEPGLLYFAQYYDPIAIAVAATLGTGIATLADYAAIRCGLKHARIRRIRDKNTVARAIRWFRRRPFATIVVFALTPLPIYVVRVLAPLAGYSYRRYVAAIMLGRLPRFYVVALIGHALVFPGWLLLVTFVVMLSSTALLSYRSRGEA